MKLLDKKTINQQRAFEKKLEIDEGAKLAKKIDLLRETASQEEAKLAKFREQSLNVLREEIGHLSKVRDELKNEIESLKKIISN